MIISTHQTIRGCRGEIEEGKLYEEKDFNRKIVIPARERYRVKAFMDDANRE